MAFLVIRGMIVRSTVCYMLHIFLFSLVITSFSVTLDECFLSDFQVYRIHNGMFESVTYKIVSYMNFGSV